jgi:hypothetical protein
MVEFSRLHLYSQQVVNNVLRILKKRYYYGQIKYGKHMIELESSIRGSVWAHGVTLTKKIG